MSKKTPQSPNADGLLRVDTHRSSPFTFQVGVDRNALSPLLDRVTDAYQRFESVPLLPDIANALDREVIVSGVYGTNTIEGGTLSETETEAVLAAETDPEQAKDEAERRALNIRAAYEAAEIFSQGVVQRHNNLHQPAIRLALDEPMFLGLHQIITDGLSHPDNIPGHYRDNPKHRLTQVGDTAHGGIYTPPKCLDDIQTLMPALIRWSNSDPIRQLPPLIRAPLIHCYFERIHPFWDGNGRVGRVMEAVVLLSADYRFSPFALSRFYMENVDEYYAVFRQAEKQEKNTPCPNTPFVGFFLRGMLETINRLHDRVNTLTGEILLENQAATLFANKAINARQHSIFLHLKGIKVTAGELRAMPWYQDLYRRLTRKTRDRDLTRMHDAGLITVDNKQIARVTL